MNFVFSEMTFLRYFIPLTIEGNKRNINSKYFIKKCKKYSCPTLHQGALNNLKNIFNFQVHNLSEIEEYPDITFFIEGVGSDQVHNAKKKISLTYMTDFRHLYGDYINDVDHIIFPNKVFAETFDKNSEKNLYLGSPKYDTYLKKEEILKKHKLGDEKKALIIFPRNKDLHQIDLGKIYGFLRQMGFTILVKTRAKSPIGDEKLKGDHYFLDSWYPHTTMELIQVSDLIVNFGSTSIKECVLLKKPVINFDIKKWRHELILGFLYDYGYCRQLDPSVDFNPFKESVDYLVNNDHEGEFNRSIEENLFNFNASKAILNHFSEDFI